jgi:hypothetical protein
LLNGHDQVGDAGCTRTFSFVVVEFFYLDPRKLFGETKHPRSQGGRYFCAGGVSRRDISLPF